MKALEKKLIHFRQKAQGEGTTNILRRKVLALYRRNPALITKEDLLLFQIIIKKK